MASAAPRAEYELTLVGAFRRAAAGQFPTPGDPAKIADAIMHAADAPPMRVGGTATGPTRLALGSDAYASICSALAGRLAALEAQRAVALSTDADDAALAATA